MKGEWTRFCVFEVDGVPQPMPKKLVGRYGQMYPNDPTGAKTGWLQAVSRTAKKAMGKRKPLSPDEPVKVVAWFHLPKPKSAKKRGHPVVKPDLTNLYYAIENALSGIVYHDDAQIIEVQLGKFYITETPFVGIDVMRLDNNDK